MIPADTQQTAAVVRAAARAGVPYVPRGFGTNLSGGSVAPRGGLVIGLARLDRILAVKPQGRYAVVQPGVTNLELQNALAPLGFFYAPDPASQKVATLGGNVGENSGGPHCLKYGVTTNHVLGMTVVLPGGDLVRTGGAALDPPGYDFRGLLVGSEGTLGIVTELVVRILPSPESVVTLLAVYDDVADAARSVSDVIAAGIVPATLEMMDATVIRAIEESKPCGYPRDAAAVLIVEVDGPAAGLQRQQERIRQLCIDNGCREVRRAKDAAERDLLWAGRRGAFGAIARLAPSFLVADCTVPRTKLPEALATVSTIASRHQLSHGNVFHAGDGNLHPLLLFDSRNPTEVKRVHQAGKEIMEACVALGGTITGEHGIGMEKMEAMRMIFSEDDLDLQRQLRGALDPDDLLNPGKIIPPAAAIEQAAGSRQQAAGSRQQAEGSRQEAEGSRQQAEGRGHLSALDSRFSTLDSSLTPSDVAEACDVVRRALRRGGAFLPIGSGLRRDFGNYSARPVVEFRSTGLASVVRHDPANQVIEVGPGMTLAALQEVLGEHGQWLPVRPPLGQNHTLGGLAALNACGPERLRYGSPRDLALGMKFVSGTGRLISAGGRVVKNVAGYDLTRLLIGSAGTLGFITELTLRVLSIPQRCTALVASGPLDRCSAAATELLGSKLEPTFVVAVPQAPNLEVDGDGKWRLIAGFEGFEETVAFQVESCEGLLAGAGLGVRDRREYSGREGMCGQFFELLEGSSFLLRIDLPPDGVLSFMSARRWGPEGAAVMVDLGCGRILAAMPSLTEPVWAGLCETSRKAGGHVILEKSPSSFAEQHDVFGPPREDWQVMYKLKTALDPHNVFAPGRMPGRK